jgi:hypothetical protein
MQITLQDGENSVEFLVNDLSVVDQFADLSTFYAAVDHLMAVREIIRQHGSELRCQRQLANARITPNAVMQQAVQGLVAEKRRAIMAWLAIQGPYWDEGRLHGSNEWLEVDGKLVTDSAVGEAAVRCGRRMRCDLISLNPSDWLFSPVDVLWIHDDEATEVVQVHNHWNLADVRNLLETSPRQSESWEELGLQCKSVFTGLVFAENAFLPLRGHPFVHGAATQIRALLHVLDRFKSCFSDSGERTAEGHRIYQDYFTGENGSFSDSSDSEKRRFKRDLTFDHPENQDDTIFCPYHGKVRTQVLRIHFSWPVRADEPLYVVYVGPKLTKT